MKTRSNLIQTCLLGAMLLLALPAVVQAQFTFITNADNTITITGSTGFDSDVSIPDTINGLWVTGIADLDFQYSQFVGSITIPATVINITMNAFSGVNWLATISVNTNNPTYSSLGGVLLNKSKTVLIRCPQGIAGSYTIPDGVTNIADSAFDFCGNLSHVITPHGLVRIGNYAFGSCYNLESIEISDTVTNIGANALLYCGLITISVATNNSAYCSVDGVLFNKRRTVLVRFPPRKTGGYAIPTTVASVGDSAFDDCTLTNLTEPASVSRLGNGVFGDCQFLTSIAILGPVTSIGNASFAGCWSLTKVTLPNTITSFGDSAFASCVALP